LLGHNVGVFNIGPLELVVLAFVGIVVLGPERIPGLARDAARLIRALREVATGARTQLRDELGPEFADLDLRSLNPRTAITQALLGDDAGAGLTGKNAWQRVLLGDTAATDTAATNTVAASAAAAESGVALIKPAAPTPHRPVEPPLGRGEAAPFDADAT
jgi:sec-independent protein translocase protein TatB